MVGENIVYLKGYLKRPEFNIMGQYNTPIFKASIAIPTERGYQYLKVSSIECAEALSLLPKDTLVYIEGHVEDKSFTVKCKHCGGYDKRAWFEIIIDNFKVLE